MADLEGAGAILEISMSSSQMISSVTDSWGEFWAPGPVAEFSSCVPTKSGNSWLIDPFDFPELVQLIREDQLDLHESVEEYLSIELMRRIYDLECTF